LQRLLLIIILHGHVNISVKTAIQRYKQTKMIIKDQSVKNVFSSHQKVRCSGIITVPTGTEKPVSPTWHSCSLEKPCLNFLQSQRAWNCNKMC